MFRLAILFLSIFTLSTLPAYSKSLSYKSERLGTSLTVEDFEFAILHPESQKAVEVKTYLHGMQNMAASHYLAQKRKAPDSLLYCLHPADELFNSGAKPNFFLDVLKEVKKREPILIAEKWKRMQLDGVVLYGLANLFPCSKFDFPTVKSGLTSPTHKF